MRVGALVAILVGVAAIFASAALVMDRAARAPPRGEIVFVSNRDPTQQGEIYLAQAGRPPRDVSNSLARDTGLSVAPDGQTIALGVDRSGSTQLYLARPDGSQLRPLSGASLPNDQAPGSVVFSPDSKQLALVLSVTVDAAPRAELAPATSPAAPPAC